MNCPTCEENSNKWVKLRIIATSKYQKRLRKLPLIIQEKMFVVERKYRCPVCHTLYFTQEFLSTVRERSENDYKLDLEKFTPRSFLKLNGDNFNSDSK